MKINSFLSKDKALETQANQLLRQAGHPNPKVVIYWNSRLQTTAGLALHHHHRICLNPLLLKITDGAHHVQNTMRHELAHLLAQHRVGKKRIQSHGLEWKLACKDLGIEGEPRCHSIPELIVAQKKQKINFYYYCPNCTTCLERVRRPKKKFACLKCCKQHNGGKYHDNYRFRPISCVDWETLKLLEFTKPSA
jgi:predicted SprT family Zn-dependent metalloprotease